MHILIAILSALAVVAFIIIRIGQVARASREIGEVASEVKGLVRKKRWQGKLNPDLVKQIDDPRLAATVMMCAVAKSDGEITERQRGVILQRMGRYFEMAEAEAEDMLAHARWLASEVKDLSSFLQRSSGTVRAACTQREKGDFVDMLTALAAVEGPASDIQADAIERLQRRIGLSP